MQHESEPPLHTQESFLGSFSRVPSGLDPTQVYSYFLKLSARVQQLEAQSQRTSAPALLEAALREATEVRTQASQAAERAYNEIVRAAEQESERLRAGATAQGEALEARGQQALEAAQRQAETLLEQAREEAARIRQEGGEWNAQLEQELERLCVDFANFLQRLLDRRKASGVSVAGVQPSTGQPASATLSGQPDGVTVSAAVPPEAPEVATPGSGLTSAPSVTVASGASALSPSQSSNGGQVHEPQPAPGVEPMGSGAPPLEQRAPVASPEPASSEPAPSAPASSTSSAPAHEPAAEQSKSPEQPKPSDQEKAGGFRLPSWLDL